MVRFDSDAAVQHAERLLDRAVDGPVAAPRRRSRKSAEPRRGAPNPLLDQAFPTWARLTTKPAFDPDTAFDAAFSAGASLALLDAALRGGANVSSAAKGLNPPFAGALRQRLALRAATACARLARLREDENALRDAEHLTPAGAGETHASPAGRIHRLWRSFASRPARIDAPSLRTAADLLELRQDLDLEALASALQSLVRSADNPLAAAARAASATMQALAGASHVDMEILALWVADLALAKRLGWIAPVPLLATTITHPSLRTTSGRRPRPDEGDWGQGCARASALAARDAYALASDLSRRSEKLLAVAPKLRAKEAGRVIDMLLDDDAVTPARASASAGLSDRAARRLFDRLVELGAVRELSGRPSFRLYGL